MSTPHTKNPFYTSPPETPVAAAAPAGLFSPGLYRPAPAAGVFSPGIQRPTINLTAPKAKAVVMEREHNSHTTLNSANGKYGFIPQEGNAERIAARKTKAPEMTPAEIKAAIKAYLAIVKPEAGCGGAGCSIQGGRRKQRSTRSKKSRKTRSTRKH